MIGLIQKPIEINGFPFLYFFNYFILYLIFELFLFILPSIKSYFI
jgi:hypothetical protein